MKFLDRFTKKFTKSASSAVKTDVKKTSIDLLAGIIGFGSMFLGIMIFKNAVQEPEQIKPTVTNTSITSNNYFLGEMSEEMIEKILEGRK